MNKLVEKIKTRGYWEVLIRPNKFVENLIESPSKCKEIIREVSVKLRGWIYPFNTIHEPPSTGGYDYIEQSKEWEFFLEYWRYYQSGQFIHFFGMLEDWQDQAKTIGRMPLEPFKSLAIISTLYTFTEIYEFASRLAVKGLLGNECTISITLHGTKDRQLVTLDFRRHFFLREYKSKLESIPHKISIPTADLIARSAELSLDHTIRVFERFNWDNPPRGIFLEEQTKLLKGLI